MATKKVYEIDGCKYKTKALKDTHEEWTTLKKKKIIKSFELPQIKDKSKRGRFFAYKPIVNDIKFDSLMEAKYYIYLLQEKKKKNVVDFHMQVKYELQPGFKKNDKKIQAINYIADFVVYYPKKKIRVIDIKGRTTVDFLLKKKMFDYKFEDLTLECIQYYEDEWLSLDEIKKRKKKK